MREIKFRGKALVPGADNNPGEWVYGYIEFTRSAIGEPSAYIHTFADWNLNMRIKVDPKTVGQFCGLLAKNGKEIYEGDIFQDEEDGSCEYVEWDNEFGGWSTQAWFSVGEFAQVAETLEVLGNIYENPELIKA